MINEPLVYFKSESSFNNKKNELIDASANNQVVFIGTDDKSKTGKIYTHGLFFGGVSGIDPETLDLSNYVKNTDNLLKINNVWYKKGDSVTVSGGNGVSTLAELTDTNINNPQNRDVLMYQDGKWINYATGSGGDNPIVPPGYEPYDDSWINDELENLDEKIEQAKARLDDIHEWSENEVNTVATNAIKNMAWYASLIDDQGLINYTGFADRLLGVGVITENSGVWSTLRLRVTDAENGLASLDAEVASLEMGGTDPDTMATLIASHLGMSVEDWEGVKTATAKLESMWTTGEVDDDDNFEAAKWFLSAYRNAANQNKTFSQVISDAANDAVGSATAALTTRVETLENGDYVTGTELLSAVRNQVGELISTSGIITTNTLGDAFATMFAENDGAKSAVLNHVISEINEDGSNIRTAIAGLVADSGDGGNAGVYVKNTELGEKTVEILTNNADAKARIVTTVKDNKSELQLEASDIKFSNDGKTVAMAINENAVAIANLNVGNLDATYAKIADLNATNAQILNLSATYATILNLDAATARIGTLEATVGNFLEINVEELNAAVAKIDELNVDELHARTLHSYSGSSEDGAGYHVVISNGELVGYNQSTDNYISATDAYRFNNDGSGFIANGTLRWDANGDIHFGQNVSSENFNYSAATDDLQINSMTLESGIYLANGSGLYKGITSNGGFSESDLILNEQNLNIQNIKYSGMISSSLTDGGSDDPIVKIYQSGILINPVANGSDGVSGFKLEVSDASDKVLMADGTAKYVSDLGVGGGNSGISASQANTFTATQTFTSNTDGESSISGGYIQTTNLSANEITIAVDHSIFEDTTDYSELVVRGDDALALGVKGKQTWIELVGDDNLAYIYSDVDVAGTVNDSSDATLKDIVSDTTLTVEQVANAPAVNFTWKKDADKEDKKVNVGTLAQYWNVVLPEVVRENKDGKLSMAYGNAAIVSSIVTAKEVVALKELVAELQRRIDELKNI